MTKHPLEINPSRGEPAISSATSGNEAELLGRVVAGKYRIDEVLGTGGMGAVYRVRHLAMEKDFALKVLSPQFSGDTEFYRRFEREARAASQIDHPNVVGVIDYGDDDGIVYYVMELLRGVELRELMDLAGPMRWSRLRVIAIQLLRGLQAAHSAGFVHRDLKPDNVFLAEAHKDRVKILDFGIVKALGSGSDDSLTVAGTAMGSPRYMSPEQCEGNAADVRSDLYSVGVLLYEVLVGRPPFVYESVAAKLRAHVGEDPPSFAELAPHLSFPAGLEAAVFTALNKRPEHRPSSADEFREILERIDGDELTAAESQSTLPREESGSFDARSVALGVIVGVIVGVACGFALAQL